MELPLGATEDRICGTIDIEKALSEGVKAYEPGLLVMAHIPFPPAAAAAAWCCVRCCGRSIPGCRQPSAQQRPMRCAEAGQRLSRGEGCKSGGGTSSALDKPVAGGPAEFILAGLSVCLGGEGASEGCHNSQGSAAGGY